KNIIFLLQKLHLLVEFSRERNPATAMYNNLTPRPAWLIRGYTGHEMMNEFGLINMNGRLYDPTIARMLSPDNFVQDATSVRGYNRYTYVLNNPLKYKDPSGEFIFTLLAITTGQWWAVPIAIGVDIGMWQGGSIANGTMNPFKWDFSSGKTWAYMGAGGVIGGVSGWVGGTVGGAIAGSSFAGSTALGAIAGGATSGAISGGGFAALSGDDIFEGAWKGAVSGASGGFVGGAIGGTAGAFLGGATAGAVGSALNGGSTEQIIVNAILGGAISTGAYELSVYANYRSSYEGNLNYSGYRRVSAVMARANFWEMEASWYEMPDGSVVRIKYGSPFGGKVEPAKPPEGALFESHTHPKYGKGFSFFGPTDIANYQVTSGTYDFKVYGGNQVFTLNRTDVMEINISKLGYWNTKNQFVPTISPKDYETNYHFNGYLHNINLYNHFLFWFR
ncbi:MAG TPA: RHS repeat-associated core domain-containing protein, partial [Bacteroidia bacterium]|nr:RHS repeat-associated core domain-containing protein [Bacteroidia bacterium]